jgi:hypothetical protein
MTISGDIGYKRGLMIQEKLVEASNILCVSGWGGGGDGGLQEVGVCLSKYLVPNTKKLDRSGRAPYTYASLR